MLMPHRCAIFTAIMFDHIDDEQSSSHLERASQFDHRRRWIVDMMKEQHRNCCIECAILQRQLHHITLVKFDIAYAA